MIVMAMQWQGSKKGKDGSKAGREKWWQDSSNGTAFRVHILVIMQFCQDILGISNLKKLWYFRQICVETLRFLKSFNSHCSENVQFLRFSKRKFLKTHSQTYIFLRFYPKTYIFIPKTWGQTGSYPLTTDFFFNFFSLILRSSTLTTVANIQWDHN